jgi:hypothetical protein
MPVGSAVAFLRDSRIDVVEADTKPLVNFIIGSQLEDSKQGPEAPSSDFSKTSQAIEPIFLNQDGKDDPAARQRNGIAPTSLTHSEDNETVLSLAISFNAESRSSDDSVCLSDRLALKLFSLPFFLDGPYPCHTTHPSLHFLLDQTLHKLNRERISCKGT